MAAPKGNDYWKLVKGWKNGADLKYNPDELHDKSIEYFQWVEDNPLYEEKPTSRGDIVKVKKMRAMTIKAFCLFANISFQTFENYSKDKAYVDITTRIRDIIYTQKFEGASADLLNSNIIARELGLAEKREVTEKSEASIKVDKWLTKEANNE